MATLKRLDFHKEARDATRFACLGCSFHKYPRTKLFVRVREPSKFFLPDDLPEKANFLEPRLSTALTALLVADGLIEVDHGPGLCYPARDQGFRAQAK
jgi:hypothetical protein